MNKKALTERDICTKYILPALEQAGWDKQKQILEEVSFTDGKIYVKGKLTHRGKQKRADYILYYKPNIPIAIIEAKDNNHSVRAGIQQGLEYAQILDIPCVFSSNGDGFLFHDRTTTGEDIETEIALDMFPSPQELWEKYKKYKGITTPEEEKIASQDYFYEASGKKPRYYQQIAINRTVEAIAKGQKRILLVMATGTGKTYTAFQIAHRLKKAGAKKRILFLADRTALIDQTRRNDFKHFDKKMTVLRKKVLETSDGKDELVPNKKKGIDSTDKAYEVFLGLYQGLSNPDTGLDAYKDFSPTFFDLIIIDECHRGSAKDDSVWREILTYFSSATQIGLTATPKETNDISNSEYFGEPIYTYSLKQGIEDGFLAPYRVLKVTLNTDAEGWRPDKGKRDKNGDLVEDRIYNTRDFDRNLVIDERTDTVARKITEFLKGYDRFAKTIVFCVDINHAERMRSALAKYNVDLVAKNYKYIMQITGDNEDGKRELDNFTNVEEPYPAIVTTSELLTTGVDAQTCKVIVLDTNITSMTKFKQIIGRGTRIREDYGKMYFTILDFRNATHNFADPQFDGEPIRIKPCTEETDLTYAIEEENEIDLPESEHLEDAEGTYTPQTPRRNPFQIQQPNPREKIFVNGVDVTILLTREIYFDDAGKPITTSLKDYTQKILRAQFASLDEFLTKWNKADQKRALIQELEEQGIPVGELYEAVGKELDLFDMLCYVAYDQPPLSRKDRAQNVKKRGVFAKYGAKAAQVLEALLEKYADEGITNIESIDVLRVKPLDVFGSPLEIIRAFGGKDKYLYAIQELTQELYKIA